MEQSDEAILFSQNSTIKLLPIESVYIFLHEIYPPMILRNISLKKYNSFGIDYNADKLITVCNEKEAISVLKEKKSSEYPFFILGSGSNILFTGDVKMSLLRPEIEGITIEEQHPEYVIVSAGAGVLWDEFVGWSVVNGFGGVENLSLIPGTVGASPIQNIGAYGVEVMDTIERVRTLSVEDGAAEEFSKNDCRFGYRTSIFKDEYKARYLITKVYYRLTTRPLLKLDYGSLKDEIIKIGEPTLKSVREAVIKIRRSKLPDPETTGNAGSFFKNPVVNSSVAEGLKKGYPKMPVYEDLTGGIKLSAGWLIEHCGWKGKRIGDAGVHDKQALVLLNYGKASGKDIYNLSEEIKKSVQERFGIELEREVEVVGTI